jgi:arylsulfatase A-like enzyme
MKRRVWLTVAAVVVLATTLLICGCGRPAEQKTSQGKRDMAVAKGAGVRPNIVLLQLDDMMYKAIGGLGNKDVKTPNLDRLMKRGTVMTQVFNQGSYVNSTCKASRAMMLSGVNICEVSRLAPKVDSWPETFAKAGYDTYITGKWCMDASMIAKCFQSGEDIGRNHYEWKPKHRYYNRPYPGDGFCIWDPNEFGHWVAKVKNFDPSKGKTSLGGDHTPKGNIEEVYTANAIRYLKEKAGKEGNPFFMYVSFNSPQDPKQAPKEFAAMYSPFTVTLWPNFIEKHPWQAVDFYTRDEALAPMPRTPYAIRVHMAEYYAVVSYMDSLIGKIADALDATGQAKNTIFIVTSDHGVALGQHGLMGGQSMYESCVRVPLIICGPGIKAGQESDAMVYLDGLYPTTCELAGIAIPQTVQSGSFATVLQGGKASGQEAVFGLFKNMQRMVRTKDYKLIVYPVARRIQLFDLKNDPWETTNLADDPRHEAKLTEMMAKLRDLQKEFKDDLDMGNPGPLKEDNVYEKVFVPTGWADGEFNPAKYKDADAPMYRLTETAQPKEPLRPSDEGQGKTEE